MDEILANTRRGFTRMRLLVIIVYAGPRDGLKEDIA